MDPSPRRIEPENPNRMPINGRRLISGLLRPAVLVPLAVVAVTLAACAQATPTATSLASSPSLAATPAVSASPTSASSSGADPDAGAALEAFRAFVQTDQTFHMRADILLTVGSQTLDMDVASDVAGADETGTIDIRGAGASIHMDLIILDGTAYARVAKGEWQTIPADTSSANPLLGLDVEGLEPVGVVNVAGQLAHHLRTDDVATIDTGTITGSTLTELTLDTVAFDVYVNDDGVPLTAVMEFAGNGTLNGKSQKVKATIRYDFSEFGKAVEIEAPI